MISDTQRADIIKAIESGLSNIDACTIANVSKEWFYKELKKSKEFKNKVDAALVGFKQKHLKRISTHGEKIWQASAWLLERKFKDEFSIKDNKTAEMPPIVWKEEIVKKKVG